MLVYLQLRHYRRHWCSIWALFPNSVRLLNCLIQIKFKKYQRFSTRECVHTMWRDCQVEQGENLFFLACHWWWESLSKRLITYWRASRSTTVPFKQVSCSKTPCSNTGIRTRFFWLGPGRSNHRGAKQRQETACEFSSFTQLSVLYFTTRWPGLHEST